MTRDSHTGLPSWMRTGIFLYTGLDLSSSGLLSPRFSSRYSYSTPFSASAIRHRCPNGLTQKSSSTTPFVSTSAIARSRSLESPSVPRVEPRHEGDERVVDETEGVTAEVLLVPQLALQQLQDLDELLLGRRLGLALELPQPFVEPGHEGDERDVEEPEGVAGEVLLVSQLALQQPQDTKGTSAMSTKPNASPPKYFLSPSSPSSSFRIPERALVPQEVLLPVLILHPLLRQRDPAPLPERAHPEVQQHHPLRVYLTHRSLSLTQMPFSHYASWWQRRPGTCLGALNRDATKQKMTMWSPPA
ncbi:hypothetical protein C4D60_Mb09t22370 [Musa balbisiana]|uniref:Uncharacterized protein n=1 Tax=Musa balbisiana TaxID=52838 RepID=A0A4S8IIC0_MUSBA|nr:hypothetical protein C4D60_Mb09t22370 [Musa balbisiana]